MSTAMAESQSTKSSNSNMKSAETEESKSQESDARDEDQPTTEKIEEKEKAEDGVTNAGWGDMFKYKEGYWKCSGCFATDIEPTKTKCPCCEKPKPGSEDQPSAGGGACDVKEEEKTEENEAAGSIGAGGFSFGADSSTSAPASGAIGANGFSFGATTFTTSTTSTTSTASNAAPAPGFTFGSTPAPAPLPASSESGKSVLSGGFNFGVPSPAAADKTANSTTTAAVPRTPFTSPVSPTSRDRCRDACALLDEAFVQIILNHWKSGYYFHDYSKFLTEYRNQAKSLQGGKTRQPSNTEDDEFYTVQLPIPHFTPCAPVVDGLPKKLGEELATHITTKEFEAEARKSSFRFTRLKTATRSICDGGVDVATPKPSRKRGRAKDEERVVEDRVEDLAHGVKNSSLNSPVKQSAKKKARRE